MIRQAFTVTDIEAMTVYCAHCNSTTGNMCVTPSGVLRKVVHAARQKFFLQAEAGDLTEKPLINHLQDLDAKVEAELDQRLAAGVRELDPLLFEQQGVRVVNVRHALWLAYNILGKDINKFIDGLARVYVEGIEL